VIDFTILNSNALIAKQNTSRDPMKSSDIRPVLLSAAARYATLDLKIPSLSVDSWTVTSNEIKSLLLPTSTARHYLQ
ncbi:Uncharacterized protein FKW44_021798, partial [Caligus rogercresseyi]